MLPSSVKSLSLHIGLPDAFTNLDAYRADGGKVVMVLTPDEKEKYQLRDGEAAFLWKDDAQLKKVLFQNMQAWKGGQIIGNDQGKIEHFAKILGELLDLANFDTHSIKVLTKDNLPVKNALQNYRWVEDGIRLARARGRGKGTAAIVIAAGPSLNSQWAELRRIRQMVPNLCFIMAGRSYKKAMEEGVTPEFVVEVEQFEWDDKIFMFAQMPPPHTVLCFPLTVCPGVPKAWPREKMVMLDHTTAQMFGLKLQEESIDGGNSILHHMLNMAVFLGCSPIYLAGADLGYPDGHSVDTHAAGTFHPWPGDILKSEHTHQERMMLPANDGGLIHSSPAYRNFRLLLEIQVSNFKEKNPGLQFYTFSPRGQKADGVEYVNIASILPPGTQTVAATSVNTPEVEIVVPGANVEEIQCSPSSGSESPSTPPSQPSVEALSSGLPYTGH